MENRKRYRAPNPSGTILDARGEEPPFSDRGSWAWLTSSIFCPSCGQESLMLRPAEATVIECAHCRKLVELKRERVLKRVK